LPFKEVSFLTGYQGPDFVEAWLRAFLLERGMVFAKTPAKLRIAMPEILENAENDLTRGPGMV
jgi:hypothetical protein